jgi:hypothetical protein
MNVNYPERRRGDSPAVTLGPLPVGNVGRAVEQLRGTPATQMAVHQVKMNCRLSGFVKHLSYVPYGVGLFWGH